MNLTESQQEIHDFIFEESKPLNMTPDEYFKLLEVMDRYVKNFIDLAPKYDLRIEGGEIVEDVCDNGDWIKRGDIYDSAEWRSINL